MQIKVNMKLTFVVISLISVIYGYPLQGVCKYKFKKAKIRNNIQDLSQIHHIIPRQFRSHPVINGVDLEDGVNLMLMPNRVAKTYMLLNTTRPLHDCGHSEYNKFVEDILDDMSTQPYSSQDEILNRMLYLRHKIRKSIVPWR